ncbi:alpha/beta fold hydrolase [Dactylosporangium sp. CA-233914]|uniref:alpha/beta fold hydrolase n=1 Tax=Dactylosporangium sp. CA-233914 TaxID=3239934 RepID=UPI003D8C60C6
MDDAELSWGNVGGVLAAAGFPVVAADHPGFGQSPPAPWPTTQERLVRYVGDLVDALGLDDYVIGGLSLGGGMALGHLLDEPGRARGAMLLGCYGIMPRLADGPLGAASHLVTWALLRTGLLGAMTRSYARNAKAMERGLQRLVRDPAQRTPELVQAVVREASTGTALATFASWQHEQVLWNRLRTNYTARLSVIRTPTLLIHGERDTGVPIERARAAARELPNAQLVVVPNAGHWVQRDRPGDVESAALTFLRGLA